MGQNGGEQVWINVALLSETKREKNAYHFSVNGQVRESSS